MSMVCNRHCFIKEVMLANPNLNCDLVLRQGKKLDIECESDSYSPGDKIKGNVIVVLDQDEHVKEVTLKAFGHSKVEWMETLEHGKSKGSEDVLEFLTEIFSDEDIYWDETSALYANVDETWLSSGHTHFQFELTVPSGIPQTYHGDYGRVEYTLKACVTFDTAEQMISSIPIKVYSNVVSKGLSKEEDRVISDVNHTTCGFREFGMFCCRRIVRLKMSLDKTLYEPGEALRFTIVVNNTSGKWFKALRGVLMENVKFIVDKDDRSCSRVALQFEGPEVLPHSEILWSWMEDYIQLPGDLPPTDLGGCRIIKVHYYLKIELVLSDKEDDVIFCQAPIIIGNVHSTPIIDKEKAINSSTIESHPNDPKILTNDENCQESEIEF